MEAMTSDGVLSLVRMISRVCGRTNRILRSSSTSACPDVLSPVRTRSNALAVDEGERRHVIAHPLDFPIGKDGRDRGGEVGFWPDDESSSLRE